MAHHPQEHLAPVVYDSETQKWPITSQEAAHVSNTEPLAKETADSISEKDEGLIFEKARQAERVRDEEEAIFKRERRQERWKRARPFVLTALALLILGWWLSATILKATRHRWIPQTVWAWFFLLVIAFRFIPNRVVTHPIEAVWQPLVSRPFMRLPYHARLAGGWLCLLGIVLGSAFGFPTPPGSNRGDRAISVLGLVVFQSGFYLTSKHRKQIQWQTVIVGLFIQQAIALFVLKSDAGFRIFNWLGMSLLRLPCTWPELYQQHWLPTFWSSQHPRPNSSLIMRPS
jgi:CNT family concentrative nucleoside transporter